MANTFLSIPAESLPQFEELYVISDLHLGGESGHQIFNSGAELARLIDYLKKRLPAKKLALLINGDFVDFLAEKDARHFDPAGAVAKLNRIATEDAAFKDVFNSKEVLPGSAKIPDKINSDQEEKDPEALWSLAHLLALYDLNGQNPKYRIWALGNLIELYLLAFIMKKFHPDRLAEYEKRALQYADMLVDLAGRDAFMVYSTRRQMLRYVEWFQAIAYLEQPVIDLANAIAEKFPEEVEDRWK